VQVKRLPIGSPSISEMGDSASFARLAATAVTRVSRRFGDGFVSVTNEVFGSLGIQRLFDEQLRQLPKEIRSYWREVLLRSMSMRQSCEHFGCDRASLVECRYVQSVASAILTAEQCAKLGSSWLWHIS
jgi:hypothetical protein